MHIKTASKTIGEALGGTFEKLAQKLPAFCVGNAQGKARTSVYLAVLSALLCCRFLVVLSVGSKSYNEQRPRGVLYGNA